MRDPLRKFGPVWGASGVQGFFGEGYEWHRYLRPRFAGVTFVAKTATASDNKGNMPMKGGGVTPKEFLPKCVYVSPRSWLHGSALNAVGLSNPGINALMINGRWQSMQKPFFISIMAITQDARDKSLEMSIFQTYIFQMLNKHSRLQDLLGIQINDSCPNTGENMAELLEGLVQQAKADMQQLRILGVPLVPKINVLLPIRQAIEIGNDLNCAGLTLSNTIPWDDLPKFGIDRKKIFGSDESPLMKRGFSAGGYSGKHLLPIVGEYVQALRSAGFTKHINAGGGVLGSEGIDLLHHSGASSFSLGSIAFLRPWRMRATIARANELFRW